MKAWQNRYFILSGQTLTYYKSKDDVGKSNDGRGTISLIGSAAGLRSDSTIRFDIDDVSGRCWQLRARSEEDAAGWLAAIHSDGARPLGPRGCTGSSGSSVMASGSSVVASGSGVRLSSLEESPEAMDKVAAVTKLQAHARRRSASKPTNRVGDSSLEGGASGHADVATSGRSTRGGYLQKLRTQGVESWQQRYFMLEGQSVTYFKHQADAQARGEDPRGTIELADARVSLRADSKVRFDIDDTSGRCWRLRASTEDEAAGWVAALKTAILAANALMGRGAAAAAAEKRKHMGYLQKLRPQGVESWQQRYFVLEGQSVTYFKHQADAQARGEDPRGTIELANARVSLRADSKVRFDIDDTSGRCWRLRASTEDEAAGWVAALKKVRDLSVTKDARPEREGGGAETSSQSLLSSAFGGASSDNKDKPTVFNQVDCTPTPTLPHSHHLPPAPLCSRACGRWAARWAAPSNRLRRASGLRRMEAQSNRRAATWR